VFSIFHVYQVFFIWLKKTLNFHVFPHVFSCIFCFPHRLKWHFHRLPLRFNKTQAPQQDPKPSLSATTSTKVGSIRRSWVKNAVIWWEIGWLTVVNTGL
jgi:hypothetical protein